MTIGEARDAVFDLDMAMHEPPPAERVEPPTGWHGRRAVTWGASEVAALMVALGLRDRSLWGESSRVYTDSVMIAHGKLRAPRLLWRKAGFAVKERKQPPPDKNPAERGKALELALVDQWRHRVLRGTAGPDAAGIVASTIQHVASVVPIEVLPVVDRHCPALSCTPDVWCRDVMGDLVAVDAKCSVHPYASTKWAGLPEHIRLQLQAQIAVLDAQSGLAIEGQGWGAGWRDHAGEPTGSVVTWAVDRDEALIAEIREAAREGWRRVERLREEAGA